MVKNKWLNALIFVGIGVVIGLGIGLGSSQRTVSRTASPVTMIEISDLEDLEEFEGRGPRVYEYDGDEVELPSTSHRGNRGRSSHVVIERVDEYPSMPFTRRAFGFGRGVLALGLIGLGIALLLMRNKNKPAAPVVEEAPPPPSSSEGTSTGEDK